MDLDTSCGLLCTKHFTVRWPLCCLRGLILTPALSLEWTISGQLSPDPLSRVVHVDYRRSHLLRLKRVTLFAEMEITNKNRSNVI